MQMSKWVAPGRTLAVAAVASVSLSVTVAASASAGTAKKKADVKGSITVADIAASSSAPTPLQNEAKAFMRKYPKANVKVEGIPDQNYNAVLKTELQGGGGPDLYEASAGTGDNAAVQTFGKAGLAANLAGQPWVSKIPPQASGFFVGKKLFGVPMDFTPYGFIYNVGDYAKWGVKPPKTLSDALAVCAAAKAKGDVAFDIAGAVPANTGVYAMMLAQSDVYAKTPNWDSLRAHGKVKFATSKGWTQALNDFVKMNNAGCFEPGASGAGFDQLTQLLGSQQAGTVAAPTFSITAIKNIPGIRLGVFGAFGSAGYGGVPGNFSNAVAMNPHTKHTALAEEFLAFLASGEGEHIFATADNAPSFNQIRNGTIPASLDLTGIQGTLKKQVKAGTISWPPAVWPNQAVYAALGTGVGGLITGQTTVSAILQSMDAAWSNGGQ